LTTGSPQSGGVIQVVQATTRTLVSNNTTTYADSGLTATITPKFSTSKVMVLVSRPFYVEILTVNAAQYGGLQIVMEIQRLFMTPATDGTSTYEMGVYTSGTRAALYSRYSACYVDQSCNNFRNNI
jgi:hypothetical protein